MKGIRCGLVALVLSCACGVTLASAPAPIDLVPEGQLWRLGPQLEILRDPGADLTLDAVRHADAFQRADHYPPRFGYTADAIWTRLRLRNARPEGARWLLELENPRLRDVRLHVERADGAVQTIATGTRLPFAQRPLQHRHFVFPLQLGAGEEVTLYLRTHSPTSHALPLRVWAPDSWTAHAVRAYLASGLLIGALLVFMLYNLWLLVVVRERNLLMFVIYVAVSAVYVAIMDGVAFQYLWPDSPWWAHRSANVMGLASALAGLLLVRGIIAGEGRMPRTKRALTLAAAVAGVLLLATPWAPFETVTGVALLFGFAYPVLLFGVTLIAWHERVESAGYFVFSFGLIAASVLTHMMHLADLVPRHFLTVHSISLGLIAGMFLISVGLANRIDRFRRARELMAEALAGAQAREADAFRHAESVRGDLALAASLQSAVLHTEAPPPHCEIAVVTRASSTLSGDMLRFSRLADGTARLFVGDAMGHDVSAGLMTMLASAAFDQTLDQPLEAVITRINDQLVVTHTEVMVTGLVLDLSPTGEARWLSAGHPVPLRISRRGNVETLACPAGMPLGWFRSDDPAFILGDTGSVRLQAGDRLLMCTDGVHEARAADGALFGEEGLIDYLSRAWDRGADLADAAAAVLQKALEHADDHDSLDDIALALLEYTPD